MAVPAWFKVDVYMANKLAQMQAAYPAGNWTAASLAQAFTNAGFLGEEGAYAHFVNFGANEEVAPNSLFDADQYYTAKAADYYGKSASELSALQVNTVKQLIKDAGMNAWTHYNNFGFKEGVNPSNNFDGDDYLAAKLVALQTAAATSAAWADKTVDDVAAAFKAAGFSALTHYLAYKGLSDAEVAEDAEFPVPESDQVTADVDGETFTLTAGADTIVGTSGNDTIRALTIDGTGAAATTLSAFDSIDGGAGTDTLNIYSDGTDNTTLPASASVSNVEIINIYNDAAAFATTGVNIDASKFAGATNINQVGLAATTMTNLAATTTATFTDVVTAAALDVTADEAATSVKVALDEVADANLTNGNTITLDVAGDALNTVNVTGTIAAGTNTPATQTLTINVEAGVDETTVTLNTAIDATVTVAENAGSTEVVDAINAAASAGGITIASDTDLITITTGAGDDDVVLSTVAAANNTAASVTTGEGDDVISVAVVGTGFTGVTATVAAGAGNDEIDLTATIADVALDVDAGAGDDEVTLSLGLANVATTDVIDGGEGTDKVILAGGGVALDAEDYIMLRDVITNFEAIEFNTAGVTADASRMSTYKDIGFDAVDATLTKVAADQVISSLGASSLTLTANGYDTGAAPTIDGDETYAGSLTVNHIGNGTAETFTIAAESVDLTVSALSDDDGLVDNSAITLEGDLVSATVTLVAALDEDTPATTADDVLETAGVIVDVSGTDLLALESLTVSGNGTATVTNAKDTALATVNAAGLDSVDVAGDAATGLVYVTTNESVAETVTLGDGLDTISIGAALNLDEGSTYAKMDTITGLNLVEDATTADTVDTALSDDIAVFFGGVAVTNFDKATTTATTLDLALVDLAASTTDDAVVFAFGGDTYIYVDDGVDDLVTDTDVLVKLTGTIDLDLLVDALNA